MTDPKHARRALAAASVASLGLGAGKAAAGLATGSFALIASALDSILDALLSLGNWLGLRWAHKPADDDHRFGHGKIEALMALGQTVVIAALALFLAGGAVARMRDGIGPEFPLVAAGAAALSMAVSALLVTKLRRAARRSGSLIVAADLMHYRMDFASQGAVLLGLLVLAWTGVQEIDALLSIVVAVSILAGLRNLAIRALADLTDAALPAELEARITAVIERHPEVQGFHELRTRQAGPQRFIALHLELPAELSFVEAHRITEEVRDEIEAAVPGAQAFIHPDPHELELDGRARRGAEIR